MGKQKNAVISTTPVIKELSESVIAAIKAASEGLQGSKSAIALGETLPDSIKELPPFFNPTLSQYVKGLALDFSSPECLLRVVEVGRTDRSALVITCPAGMATASHKAEDVEWDRAFNAYISTFRKRIQVTDEMGDPVLNENKEPVIVEGKGNAIWEAAQACADASELINFLKGKRLYVQDIKRNFGPAVFVQQPDGSNKATSHKMTSLPLFGELA